MSTLSSDDRNGPPPPASPDENGQMGGGRSESQNAEAGQDAHMGNKQDRNGESKADGDNGPEAQTARGSSGVARLTLRRAAELHGISPSYLSRRVRAGKPAKGYDLTGYAQIEGGRVEGFAFPSDYEFPEGELGKGDGEAPLSPGERSEEKGPRPERKSSSAIPSENGAGQRPTLKNGPQGDREEAAVQEKEGGFSGATPSRSGGASTGDVPHVNDGFASSVKAFRAGKETWGNLQRVGPDGEPCHLEYFHSEDPATIDRVAEKYGAGTYRLSRMASGQDVHFTFEVSRQAPSEVERRLAAADEVEHRNQYLEERRHEAEKRAERLEREVEELEETLGEEIQKREQLESELRIFRESFEDDLEWEKKQLRWEMEDKVAEQTFELREEKRKLKETLRKKEREHERQVDDLEKRMRQMEREHELEKVKLKNNSKWPEKAVELAEEVAGVARKNPDLLWRVGYQLLVASGLQDLAQKLMNNWREARAEAASQGEPPRAGREAGPGRKEHTKRSSDGQGQEDEKEGQMWDGQQPQRDVWEDWVGDLRDGVLAIPSRGECRAGCRQKRKAPLRPEVVVWDVVCP